MNVLVSNSSIWGFVPNQSNSPLGLLSSCKTVRMICANRLSDLYTVRAVEAAAKTFLAKHRNLKMPNGIKSSGATTTYGRNLLHRDEEYGFVVIAMVWPPGTGSPAHDHGTWGVVAVAENEIEVVNYERRDDGSVPNHAELIPVLTVSAPRGSVGHVLPPWNDYHALTNHTGRVSISIHTYGKEPLEFNRYLSNGQIQHGRLSYDFELPSSSSH